MSDWSLARKAMHRIAIERMRPNPAWQAMIRKYLMNDIVEELRHCLANDTAPDAFLVREVIDEIERLRQRVAILEARTGAQLHP